MWGAWAGTVTLQTRMIEMILAFLLALFGRGNDSAPEPTASTETATTPSTPTPTPTPSYEAPYESEEPNPATGYTRTPPATSGGGAGSTQPGGFRRV